MEKIWRNSLMKTESRKTFQSMKMEFNKEIGSLKKKEKKETQTEIKLKMQTSGSQTKSSNLSITNRLKA